MPKTRVPKKELDAERICRRCLHTKPADEFQKIRASDGVFRYLSPYCSPCKRAYARERHLKRWGGYAHTMRMEKYGLTKEQFLSMVEEQHNLCYICGKASTRTLSVDHCHTSGKVGRLLCHSCNVSLGLLKDSVPTLERMIAYIKEYRNAKI